jgi:hypothetical protein
MSDEDDKRPVGGEDDEVSSKFIPLVCACLVVMTFADVLSGKEEGRRQCETSRGAYLVSPDVCSGRSRFSLEVAQQPDVGRKVRTHPFV